MTYPWINGPRLSDSEIFAMEAMFDTEWDAEALDVPLTAIHMANSEPLTDILNPLRVSK